MSLDEKFDAAAAAVKACTQPATTEEKLELYGLFKQANNGDNNTDQPWAVQVEARSKWDAWTKNKGMSQEDAKNKYIEVATAFVASHS